VFVLQRSRRIPKNNDAADKMADAPVETVHNLVGQMNATMESPRDARREFLRVYALSPQGAEIKRDGQRIMPIIASPTAMAWLFNRADPRITFEDAAFVQVGSVHASTRAQREYNLEVIQEPLPALLDDETEHVVHAILGDSPVTTDAQEQVDTDYPASHERAAERFQRLRSEIMARLSAYSPRDRELASSSPPTAFLDVIYKAEHDIDLPKLCTGYYFLAVPFREGAVYPLPGGEDSLFVQRPFIIALDELELESISWSQRVNEDAMEPDSLLHEASSTSGYLRGTPCGTTTRDTRHDDVRTADVGIHVYADYGARKIQLLARRSVAGATYGYGEPRGPEMAAEVWEQRIPVHDHIWERVATQDDVDAYNRQAALDSPNSSPTRPGGPRRIMQRPHYLSVTWRLFALGDQDDVMADHNFWARHIAHTAQTQPTVVSRNDPSFPTQAELSIFNLPIVSKQQYMQGPGFIAARRTNQ
jgi:hypothetical protein